MSAPAKITAPAPAPRVNRMTLAAVTRGVTRRPYREFVHGVDGVGKSTFAADAPDAIFLCGEDGTSHLDVARFPQPTDFDDCRDAVRTLTDDPGSFRTLVIDTADWIEAHVHRAVCADANVTSIEDVGGGFGKGYVAAVDKWRALLADLERLQATRGLNVVILAHSAIKLFKNPEGDDFERYQVKMHDKSAALIREWCQGVYFANYETFAHKDKAKRVRGVSTGARLLYTQRTAAYDAKNRYNLPESIPLDWASFVAAVEAGAPADPDVLAEEITRKLQGADSDLQARVLDAVSKALGNASALARINDKLNAVLAERAAAADKGE